MTNNILQNRIVTTRLTLRHDSIDHWLSSDLLLYPGEPTVSYEFDRETGTKQIYRIKIGKKDLSGNMLKWRDLPYLNIDLSDVTGISAVLSIINNTHYKLSVVNDTDLHLMYSNDKFEPYTWHDTNDVFSVSSLTSNINTLSSNVNSLIAISSIHDTKITNLETLVNAISSDYTTSAQVSAIVSAYIGSYELSDYYKKSETSSANEISNALSNKADKATTLSGYGITDAKIENGTITLGNNSITPLTEHQTLSDYYKKSETSSSIEISTKFNDYYKKTETSSASELNIKFNELSIRTISVNADFISCDFNHIYTSESKLSTVINQLAESVITRILAETERDIIDVAELTGSPFDEFNVDTAYTSTILSVAHSINNIVVGQPTEEPKTLYDARDMLSNAINVLPVGLSARSLEYRLQYLKRLDDVLINRIYNLDVDIQYLSNIISTDIKNLADNYYTKTQLSTANEISSALSFKADKATKLSGYGITDAKIQNGTITLGNNSITPLTAHQSLTAYVTNSTLTSNYYNKTQVYTKSEVDGKIPSLDGYATEQWVLDKHYLTAHQSLSNYYNKSEVDSKLTPINNSISTINDKIPEQATSSNKLADKQFVNSSIATNTANFVGTYSVLSDLTSLTATNNDYGFYEHNLSGNNVYDRYKYTVLSGWLYEYTLNNSSFTASQWAAINSGVTQEGYNNKADKATTLTGYGITDAKIENGTITLGNNSITPLTAHQSLTAYVTNSTLTSNYYNKTTVDDKLSAKVDTDTLSNYYTIPEIDNYTVKNDGLNINLGMNSINVSTHELTAGQINLSGKTEITLNGAGDDENDIILSTYHVNHLGSITLGKNPDAEQENTPLSVNGTIDIAGGWEYGLTIKSSVGSWINVGDEYNTPKPTIVGEINLGIPEYPFAIQSYSSSTDDASFITIGNTEQLNYEKIKTNKSAYIDHYNIVDYYDENSTIYYDYNVILGVIQFGDDHYNYTDLEDYERTVNIGGDITPDDLGIFALNPNNAENAYLYIGNIAGTLQISQFNTNTYNEGVIYTGDIYYGDENNVLNITNRDTRIYGNITLGSNGNESLSVGSYSYITFVEENGIKPFIKGAVSLGDQVTGDNALSVGSYSYITFVEEDGIKPCIIGKVQLGNTTDALSVGYNSYINFVYNEDAGSGTCLEGVIDTAELSVFDGNQYSGMTTLATKGYVDTMIGNIENLLAAING